MAEGVVMWDVCVCVCVCVCVFVAIGHVFVCLWCTGLSFWVLTLWRGDVCVRVCACVCVQICSCPRVLYLVPFMHDTRLCSFRVF